MSNVPNVLSIREAVRRAKADGMPVSEHALRRWIKTGEIPARNIGNKALLFYPNLLRYLQCEAGSTVQSTTVAAVSGIRRVER